MTCIWCNRGDPHVHGLLEDEVAKLRANADENWKLYRETVFQLNAAKEQRDAALLQVSEIQKKFDLATVGGMLDVRDCPKCHQKWPEFGCSSFMTCYRCRHKAELEESNRLLGEVRNLIELGPVGLVQRLREVLAAQKPKGECGCYPGVWCPLHSQSPDVAEKRVEASPKKNERHDCEHCSCTCSDCSYKCPHGVRVGDGPCGLCN